MKHSSLTLIPRRYAVPLIRGTIAAAAFLCIHSVHAQLYDFNTPGQLEDDFTHIGGGTTSTIYWLQQNSGGLNNSGWITTDQGTGSNVRYSEILHQSFDPGSEAFTLSLYFQWQTNSLLLGDLLQVGIGRSTDSQVPFTPTSTASSSQRLQLGLGGITDKPNQVRFYGSNLVNGVNSNFNPPSATGPTATLIADQWYFLKLDFAPTSENDGYTVTLSLFESGNTGAVGDSLMSWSTTQINANLLAGDVQAYITSRNGPWSGIVGIDNFYVSPIPEPSVAWLAGPALLALGLLRRRKTSSLQAVESSPQ